MLSHEDFTIGQKWIVSDEGLQQLPYRDTKGNETIGVGINLKYGLTRDECIVILQMRMLRLQVELHNKIPFFAKLSPNRQLALVNIAYNVGVEGLLGFRNMLAALEREDFTTASVEALKSISAKELPNRYQRIAFVIENDKIALEDFSNVTIPCLTIAIDSSGDEI